MKKLWLRFCQLKDKGVNNLLDILDETRRNTHLNSLYLDCNSITCKGAKQIAQVDCNYIYLSIILGRFYLYNIPIIKYVGHGYSIDLNYK